MAYANHRCLIILTCLFFISLFYSVKGQLRVHYYSATCPRAERIIRRTVHRAFVQNSRIPAGLLRMHFHDCFVRGCDASVLIDGNGTEKNAIPNLSLHGFEVIDNAKSTLEAICPGVVSCADILAYAARDSVVLTGGPNWQVPGGRKDGLVSLVTEPLQFLPPPFADVAQLTRMFAAQHLTQDDMITLSGGHTIGVSHCAAFINRLQNFSSSVQVDPTLNPFFASRLQQLCPLPNPDPNIVVPIDFTTPRRFDNAYYTNLRFGRGVFTSDQVLFTDASTRNAVIQMSRNKLLFWSKFARSMIKMSSIGAITGTEGEIRENCRMINSA